MEQFNQTEYNGMKLLVEMYYPALRDVMNGIGWGFVGNNITFVDLAIKLIAEKDVLGMTIGDVLANMYQFDLGASYDECDYIMAAMMLRMASEEFPND